MQSTLECSFNKLQSNTVLVSTYVQNRHCFHVVVIQEDGAAYSHHDDIHEIHPVFTIAIKINGIMMPTNYLGLSVSLKEVILPFSPELASFSWWCTWVTFKRFYFRQLDRFSWCKAVSYEVNRCISEWLCLLCRFLHFKLVYRRIEQ